MTTNEADKIVELLAKANQISAFEFEGVIFEGYLPEAIKEYVMKNESRPFYVWLHDTHAILNRSNNKKL